MAANKPRYSAEEMRQRADEIFAKIRPTLKNARKRDFLAIEVETGEYEVDADDMAATERLHARIPGAQIWMRRVGSPYARHFGGRPIKEDK